jgi:crotonobetainyl-CoA:carnitine CoA-transferase CaiB-like acyl-CoA transferase
MTGPLVGIRVLDATAALSGPVATQILGDMGADVIKVEPPDGDTIRGMGPARHDGMGAMFLHTNRSKRSIVLDLKEGSAREAFVRLAGTCDIVVSNTRPKAMARLGLDYANLIKGRPDLVYVSIVGYGAGGPESDKPAYDDLIQAVAGIPSLHAPGESARYAPIAVADRVTGICAANAALGAMVHKLRTGQGQYVEVPMFETIAALVLADHMAGLTFEPPLGPPIFQRYVSIRRPFPTADGSICLMVLTDKQWRTFFRTAGQPEVMNDERFTTVANRTRNLEALYEIVASLLKQRKTGEWIILLQEADIPAARLETVQSLISHAHLVETGFFQQVEHPSEGTIRVVAKTSNWSLTQPGPTRPTPRLGEHTREVLAECGYSQPQIDELVAAGAAREAL